LISESFKKGFAFSAPPDNFTAKMAVGGIVMPMAKMGTKWRTESPMMKGLVTLSLPDTKKTIMMSPAGKTYFEQPIGERMPSIHDANVTMEKKKVGSETIDSHSCVKYDVIYYHKDKPSEKYQGTIWEAQDLGGLVIRYETAVPENKRGGGPAKVVTEFKEIKVGAAQASMFEVPSNYRKVSNMMELMGNMGK
jgi:hypothetical protein